MNNRTKEFLQNSSAVVKRNIGMIRRYFIFTVISYLLLRIVGSFILLWVVFAYNSLSLFWYIVEFIIDYLDSVLALCFVSKHRQNSYDKRVERSIQSREIPKKKGNILMPYQTTSITPMPQVMVYHMDDE